MVQLANFSGERKKPCSFSTFLRFWNTNYPKLILLKPREDICSDCYKLSNAFCSLKSYSHGAQPETAEIRENIIVNAKSHCERAKKQRTYFNQATLYARQHPTDTVDCLVMDYAQNLALPSYNSEQPGDIYYLIPLSVFCFGIVDQKLDKLTAYIYKESFAKKGGNNVSSLLMHYLEEKG